MQRQDKHGAVRSDADFARIVVRISQAVGVDVVICGTETGALFREVHEIAGDLQLVAASPNADICDKLARDGYDVLQLSARVPEKHRQARHVVSMALRLDKVLPGDLVVCAVGHDLGRSRGDLVLVTDIEASAADVDMSELVKLTNGIRPRVLEAALEVASRIGRVTRRGKRLGALFVLGDSSSVLDGSRQLIPNPFRGHDDAARMLTSAGVQDTLIEFAKLDGAFVVRCDGLIRTAGAFLSVAAAATELPAGLGARHATAAAVTAITNATAVVVSATDGNVRAFADGELVLQLDPHVPLAPLP